MSSRRNIRRQRAHRLKKKREKQWQPGPCGKRKLTREVAMLVLARNEVLGPSPTYHRREKRMYYCKRCNAYHLTSKDKGDYRKQR